MKSQLIPRFSRLTVVAVLVLASACTDGPVATRGLSPAPGRLTAEYECTVEVAAGTTHCQPVSFQVVGKGVSPDLLLYPEHATTVNTGGGVYLHGNAADEDTTIVNVAVKNRMAQPIGTTDGVTADPNGNRLVFTTAPYVFAVYSGTIAGTSIRLGNPDGTATFTDGANTYANRQYYTYVGVLAKDSTSASKGIWFVYSPNVKTFRYSYRISTPVQYEQGWIEITPAPVPVLAPAGTVVLTGTAYNQFGVVQSDPITWSSSNSAVATVNASTGQVTAVGEGTATITATSSVNGQRTGTRAVIVDAAPAVDSTAPADGTFNAAPGTTILVYFSEAVSVSGGSFSLGCTSGSQPFTISGSGTTTVTLTPVSSLPTGDTCTVNVVATSVSDVDANDGPDQLAENYSFTFVVEGFGG